MTHPQTTIKLIVTFIAAIQEAQLNRYYRQCLRNQSRACARGYIETIQDLISGPDVNSNPVLRAYMDSLCTRLIGRPCSDVAEKPPPYTPLPDEDDTGHDPLCR